MERPSMSLGDLPPRRSSRSLTTTLLVNNIHCASCVNYAKNVLFALPHVQDVEISIAAYTVRIRHGPPSPTAALVRAMTDAAFEVFHATTHDESGVRIRDIDKTSLENVPQIGPSNNRWSTTSIRSVQEKLKYRKKIHMAYCDSCQWGEARKWDALDQEVMCEEYPETDDVPILSSPQPPPISKPMRKSFQSNSIPEDDEYSAQVGIIGMTCSACVNAVTTGIEELQFVKSVTVNLLTNNASLTFSGPRTNIDKIIERIEDLGFDGRIDEINHKPPQKDMCVANLSITGMTCGACVGTVTRAVQELPFISEVTIDLLGNCGRVEFEGSKNLDKIPEKIEDIGFEATVVDCVAAAPNESDDGPKARSVSIKVDGMFSPGCPQTVLNSLALISGEMGVAVDEEPTMQKPILKVTYVPNPPSVTIRGILAAIESGHQSFKASVYHPPSIEERSREMQKRERKHLLLRLLFVFIVAIPTFLIGILWMAIVPKDNHIRMYFEEPVWVGSVSRLEWALLIMTTPVMFYGTDVFHVRALKEIRSLWRRSSCVPILRRFYRFGSMNMLISAGTSVAYFASLGVLISGTQTEHKMQHTSTYFDTVVFLTMFILSGRALEAYSKAKTGDTVAMLGKLRPSEAYLVGEPTTNRVGGSSGPSIRKVHVDLLEIGDTVNVPHGASPPADGLVTGSDPSYKFDESSLTGESMPVRKVAGDKVYSGSINVGQPVSIQITGLGSTSMLDQIVAVVREGQAKRAPVERFADLVTGYFVPCITLIAITTFVTWLSLGLSGVLPPDYLHPTHGGWPFWSLKFAIAVFVVACPCGLALAAPTALFVGGGLAAKRGILVRGGGEAFQEASRLNAIVFDKTGTLTEGGTLQVSDHEVLIANEGLKEIAWAVAQTLEENSTHPIARAIAEFCKSQTSASVLSSSVSEIGGQGMKGTFTVAGPWGEQEYEAAIGNQRLLQSLKRPDTNAYYLDLLLQRYQSAGKSTAILCIRETSQSTPFMPAIVFATSDPIRAEAPKIIEDLREKKVDVYMCTGDNPTTAHAVAFTLGIPTSNVMANVLPNQKAEYVRAVQGAASTEEKTEKPSAKDNQNRKIVAFVGDGTNDTPALAAADVSIAMASGSDVAVNSAGFILLNSDLQTILELCVLSRRVFRRVKWNFLWAAVYNLSLIPVAAGVFYPIICGHVLDDDGVMTPKHWRLDPVWAALAMAMSSVSVVLSSLALRIERRSVKKWFRGVADVFKEHVCR